MLNTENRNIDLLISWGLSLVGRAPALHAGGQEFDSPSLHQIRGKTKQRFVREFKQTAMLCAGTHGTKLNLRSWITEISK
jgi:hypothetical protein